MKIFQYTRWFIHEKIIQIIVKLSEHAGGYDNCRRILRQRQASAAHTSDSEVFQACDEAIAEIKNLVRIIVNEFGGTNVLITADHGFLYTYSPLNEDDKVDKNTPNEQDVEIDRRYLITRKGAKPNYLREKMFALRKRAAD